MDLQYPHLLHLIILLESSMFTLHRTQTRGSIMLKFSPQLLMIPVLNLQSLIGKLMYKSIALIWFLLQLLFQTKFTWLLILRLLLLLMTLVMMLELVEDIIIGCLFKAEVFYLLLFHFLLQEQFKLKLKIHNREVLILYR